jgi:hypothetical protein
MNLGALTLTDLSALYDAYEHASDGLLAVINQPRCRDGDGAAEAIIDGMIEGMSRSMETVAAEAARRRPQDYFDRTARTTILIKCAIYREEFLPALEHVAEAMAADLMTGVA